MKTRKELLTLKKSKWAVVDERGKRVEVFRCKTTAEQSLPKLKLNKREVLKVVEI